MERKKEAKKAVIKQKEVANAIADASTRGSQFESFLSEATESEGLLQRFAELLKDCCSANSVYFARLCNDAFDEQGGEPAGAERDPSLDYLRFTATTDADKALLAERVNAGEGVVLDLFEPEEPPAEEYEEVYDEETGEYTQVLIPPPPQQPRTVFVPNVLAGPLADRLKLFGLPRAGCFLSVRVQYESCLHDLVLDEADARAQELEEQRLEEEERRLAEEEEDAERRRQEEEDELDMDEDEVAERRAAREEEDAARAAALAAAAVEETPEQRAERLEALLTKRTVSLALCVDTLGQGRRLRDEEVSAALRLAAQLQATLTRLDRQVFREERRVRELAREEAAEAGEGLSEEDRAAEIEAQWEQARRAVPEGARGPAVADVALQHRVHLLLTMRARLLAQRGHHVCRGPLVVWQAALALLGHADAVGDEPMAGLEWSEVRARIDEDLVARLEDMDIRARHAAWVVDTDPTQKRRKQRLPAEGSPEWRRSMPGLEALIANVDVEDLATRNPVLYELYGLIGDAARVWERADKEHRQRMARERARIKAEKEEEEEAARLLAEQAEMEAEEQEAEDEDYE
jgi:hypothetical protein